MNMIAVVLIITGGLFLALSGLGILRMPDVFDRLQAGTKASTLGTICTILGVLIAKPQWTVELMVIIALVLLGAPVASSVLARAVYFTDDAPDNLSKDDFKGVVEK